jgi:hypothetical protein
MYRPTTVFLTALVATLGVACGNGGAPGQGTEATAGKETSVPAVTFTPDEKYDVTAKPGGPVRISYRIIGTPIVGQPVTVDLKVESNVGDAPITLSYATNDPTAMTFPESQLRSVALAFVEDAREAAQQVTVVPTREGRLFLNVAAQMQTDTGSLQTVTAIPLQVGAAPRQLEQNGVVGTDENGELIREMPAAEN